MEEVVKVLDFGIAKLLQGGRRASQTVVGARIGTAMYMSPEQLEGREASPRSDVYALGLVLIEILTGRLPWGKTGTETDQAVTMLRLINPPKRLREMCAGRVFSIELQKLLDDLLAFEPAQRPADAGELIRRLASVPEAASLAQRSSRRTEGSQMFEAAFLSAHLKPELVADTPLTGTELPETGPRTTRDAADTLTPYLTPVLTVVTAGRPAERLTHETPPDDHELASVPTVVTLSRSDIPRFPSPPVVKPQSFDGETPAMGSDLPSVPTVVTGSMSRGSLAATLQTGMSFVGDKREPTTQPMRLARSPDTAKRSALRRLASSDAAFRFEIWRSPTARASMLVSLIVALLFIGAGLLRSGRDTRANPKDQRVDLGTGERRPTVVTTSQPLKQPVVIPTEFPLSVEFSRKRHPRAQVQCGARPCVENCQLAPGEVCTARAVGFKPRQYSYAELKPLAQAGRVDVEIRLNR